MATSRASEIVRICEDAVVGRHRSLPLLRIILSLAALLLLSVVILGCLRSLARPAPLFSDHRWSACACPCF